MRANFSIVLLALNVGSLAYSAGLRYVQIKQAIIWRLGLMLSMALIFEKLARPRV